MAQLMVTVAGNILDCLSNNIITDASYQILAYNANTDEYTYSDVYSLESNGTYNKSLGDFDLSTPTNNLHLSNYNYEYVAIRIFEGDEANPTKIGLHYFELDSSPLYLNNFNICYANPGNLTQYEWDNPESKFKKTGLEECPLVPDLVGTIAVDWDSKIEVIDFDIKEEVIDFSIKEEIIEFKIENIEKIDFSIKEEKINFTIKEETIDFSIDCVV